MNSFLPIQYFSRTQAHADTLYLFLQQDHKCRCQVPSTIDKHRTNKKLLSIFHPMFICPWFVCIFLSGSPSFIFSLTRALFLSRSLAVFEFFASPLSFDALRVHYSLYFFSGALTSSWKQCEMKKNLVIPTRNKMKRREKKSGEKHECRSPLSERVSHVEWHEICESSW